ncbi:MAG TPA: 3-isopropylmalate dehydratase small subunit [Candidatus Lambdaproteobacteria bacterium]|jgi:3-isopropylmalate/(R)-2-methylmalate dehydratase small subunit|nr:3-isopropylmalate dehydratase small subunit [Deltaproteobacteria bacterium]HIA57885.1 3-isopropylmalate dehydratase small subunit [Candidatus Lambdaproteobacteria bacterium]HIB44652.1 3-isopropylmalate dehydratase small subunit [Candidatus Lambdaproteobacteria bacterium]HIN48739.1 3-isopropylmalate dehydratase small subunit [Deltaproteobacteria bacterium]HIO11194.1 3-isopropylmalate dehydratase small subunit [Deltaproteobacteria bacterium]
MEAFITLSGMAAPLDKINVDTDQIIPKQFLKKIERTGFGIHLFHDWRYLDDAGTESNSEFVLNFPRYQGSKILLTRENFGCGSSREHAPWALQDYGFYCVIASSFADIFYSNCRKNGMLAVVLRQEEVQALFEEVEANEGCQLTVDLPQQTVSTPEGKKFSFEIDPFAKNCLLKGLDDIGWTLQFEEKIQDYEQQARSRQPWLFLDA